MIVKGNNMNKNKGFTLVEVVVSFVLIIIVMIYLIRTITVVIDKNNELLIMEEYSVFEKTLLDKIYDDIENVDVLNITNQGSSIYFNEIGKTLLLDKESNCIIYDNVVYELPDLVYFSDDDSLNSVSTSDYFIININLKLDNKNKKFNIIHQNNK